MHVFHRLVVVAVAFGKALAHSDLTSLDVVVEDACSDRGSESRCGSLLQRSFSAVEQLQQETGLRSWGTRSTSEDTIGSKHIFNASGRLAGTKKKKKLVGGNVLTTRADRRKHSLASLTLSTRAAWDFSMYILLGGFLLTLFTIWCCWANGKNSSQRVPYETFSKSTEGKVYAYNNERLLTWWSLVTRTPSIVLSWRVWIIVPSVLCIAYGIALAVVFKLPYATMFDTESINEFSKYLRVFIAFMLGLFMNNSFGRFASSVANFTHILSSLKQFMWTVRLLKCNKELTEELEKKCIVACYILDAEVRMHLGCKAEQWHPTWKALWNRMENEGLLTKEEARIFRRDHDGALDIEVGRHSKMIWSWIGQITTRVREEPGVLAPMYVRLVFIPNACLNLVDQLKNGVQVQIPFTYAYLLSTIVHLNNILLAICCGIQIGFSVSGLGGEDKPNVYKAAQILAVQTGVLVVQPVMYQACLVIAHNLNHPFGDQVFNLPTETYIEMMREEFQVMAKSFDLHCHEHHRLKRDVDEAANPGSEKGENDDDDDDDDDD